MAESVPDARPLIRSGNANHFRGIVAVNGTLTLTDTHLTFRAGRLSLQSYEESYPLTSVKAVEPRRGLALVGDGVALLLEGDREERFVIFGRRDWMREIQEARDALAIRAAP